MADRDSGHVLGTAVTLVAAVGLAATVLATVALASVAHVHVQTAADAAALAAAEQLALQVQGSDAATWTCGGGHRAGLERAAGAVARANGAELSALERSGCEVVVTVGATRRLAGGRDVGLRATARARVSPGRRPGGAPLRPLEVPGGPLRRGTLLAALVAEADRIDRLALPYVWGGGHQSSPAPPNGPFDCSGAVSRVLQAVGYPIPTLVSRQFMTIGRPGAGRVTIWAYDGHVFMTIDGRGWGTGSAPRGGAGWLTYNRPYHARFIARHLPEFEDDTVLDLPHGLGTVAVGAAGTPPRVELVAVDG